MSTTYSGFLIECNLRCYQDLNGKLQPRFIHTEFATIEEAKAKIDKFWQEHKEWQAKVHLNLAKSFEVLKSDGCGHDENTDAEDFAARVDAYYENELNQDI